MVRRKIFPTLQNENFRLRGKEICRVEALSDAVFAFSVSLLVMSLEVPQTFGELTQIVKGAVPFFTTVSVIFILWYQQHSFFRHYGINDVVIIVLNLVYLAVILFYVYPLKFLFAVLISSWTHIDLFPVAREKGLTIITGKEFPELIILFSLGYMVIWLLLFLMYKRALYVSKALSLTKYEISFTKHEARGAWWNALIGFSAALFAWRGHAVPAGICYLLIPFVLVVNSWWFKKNLKIAPSK